MKVEKELEKIERRRKTSKVEEWRGTEGKNSRRRKKKEMRTLPLRG